MPKAFPVMPAFPPPNWVDNLTLPQSAKVTVQMLSGHTSVLRISKVQTGAMFQAEWHALTEANLRVWQEFWKEVDTWDVVSFPDGPGYAITGGFWPVEMGDVLARCYINASPTGWWRMKVPRIERTGHINEWSMNIDFEGVID